MNIYFLCLRHEHLTLSLLTNRIAPTHSDVRCGEEGSFSFMVHRSIWSNGFVFFFYAKLSCKRKTQKHVPDKCFLFCSFLFFLPNFKWHWCIALSDCPDYRSGAFLICLGNELSKQRASPSAYKHCYTFTRCLRAISPRTLTLSKHQAISVVYFHYACTHTQSCIIFFSMTKLFR